MPTRSPEYRLRPETESDLEEIWLYTLEEWSLEQANDYIDQLLAAFVALAGDSKRATACDHIRPGCRFSRCGWHVIYFREMDYGVEILRVLHDRMLPSRHL